MRRSISAAPPWYFAWARQRISRGKRGGYLLLRICQGLGLLERKAAWFRFPEVGGPILMPLNWPGLERQDILRGYEKDALGEVRRAMALREDLSYVLIDAGAEAGVYSRLLLETSRRIERVVAFEPNPAVFPILRENLSSRGVSTDLRCAAVANESGRGTLLLPPEDRIPHAMYLEKTDQGEVPVERIDDLELPPHQGLVLKLDIEGGEHEALLGARRSLEQAEHFVVQMEAHRGVAQRTGREPLDSLRWLRGLSGNVGISWVACNEREGRTYRNVSLEQPFFTQFPDGSVYDLVAWKGGVPATVA